jgi:solute carrier family 25 phosphate transporter 23/24/25/41
MQVSAMGEGAEDGGGEGALLRRARRVLEGSHMAIAGGGAGVIARTASAPFDRVKLLFQVQSVGSSGVGSAAYTSLPQAFLKVIREEGVLAFWKGNGTNIIRIAPYSATQMSSNDFYKRMLADDHGSLSVARRLTAGALAGMTGTAITHPLDVVRLRLALPEHPYRGTVHAFGNIARSEGVLALYKGITPTLAGIAPYAACNFAAYDLIKSWYYRVCSPALSIFIAFLCEC